MIPAQVSWPEVLASAPLLRLLHTVHYHQHMNRIKYHLIRFRKCLETTFVVFYQFFVFQSNSFCNMLIYLLVTSSTGFMALKALSIRNPQELPKDIDMLFTAVSAATVSSMSTVEMEVFSNSQLIVLTILMLLGGEVFTSLLGLQFKRLSFKYKNSLVKQNQAKFPHSGEIELKPNTVIVIVASDGTKSGMPERSNDMKYTALLYLSYVAIGYFLVIHIGGAIALLTYIYLVSSAKRVLRAKDLSILTFSIFTTVSSFSSCGFVPTNENMIVFKGNLGLLLTIISQCLLGGTMYSPALRSVLWLLKKITKRNEFEYILSDDAQMGYGHLFPWLHSLRLTLTVLVFLVVQFVTMCAMEWRNEVSEGLNVYAKVVNYLFLAVNSRHTGESTVDLSKIAPAILVLFVFMMYLPPCTTFMPSFKDEKISDTRSEECECSGSGSGSGPVETASTRFLTSAAFSQLSFLGIFVLTICITERDKLSEDPLNFNVFSIVFEVVSAYGNVGYSMGYSCGRRLNTLTVTDGDGDGDGARACQDLWIGFVGRWSNSGKALLIFVMFFGRLKKYTNSGQGNAWKLRCRN